MTMDLRLPPGFRFHPTDEELVTHYLRRKCASLPIHVPIIAEIDLYKYHPWDLPELALYGEKEWYFFSPRDRKYPNGSRPNRAAGCGYWKATGVDKPIGKPKAVAIKKALVFYAGKAPNGQKTDWIMHEYRLANVDRSPGNNNHSLKLDDWILCRIYNKKGKKEKLHVGISEVDDNNNNTFEEEEKKPDLLPPTAPRVYNEMVYRDPPDHVPRLYTDSSGSEHVVSPEFTYDNVQSNQPTLAAGWGKNGFDFRLHYMDAASGGLDDGSLEINNQIRGNLISPLQDIFMHVHKPFWN